MILFRECSFPENGVSQKLLLFWHIPVVKLQVEPFGSERVRKKCRQICGLDLEILNPDEVDVEVGIELTHELTAGPAWAAEVAFQIGGNRDRTKIVESLKKGKLLRI